jgi:PTH1 family peptidyl-tRNA hydrolase
MYLIVGLGNPESEYSNTRHNIGFDVVNQLAQTCKIQISKTKFKGLYGEGNIGGEKVILLKPQTYMNLSGESLIQFKNFYKIENENIIVVYDDIDLELGALRIRKQGGAGTHNGMKSVVSVIGKAFTRIRIGMGEPYNKEDIINYVIGKISKKEREVLDETVIDAVNAIKEIVTNGVDIAMNKFN